METKEEGVKRIFDEIKDDPFWNVGKAHDELLKKAEELWEEGQQLTGNVEDQTIYGKDIVSRFEAVLFLSSTPILAGIYNVFILLNDYGLLEGIEQQQLCRLLNLSDNTYTKYRRILEEKNLIKVTPNSQNPKQLDIELRFVPRLDNKQVMRMPRTHGKRERLRLLLEWRKQIHPLTEEEEKKEIQLLRSQQAQTLFETSVKEEAQKIVKKKEEAKKKEEQRFPAPDYVSVIDAYKRCKGVVVNPRSPDEMRLRRSIKQMFLSGHSVKDIIACMEFFRKYHKREGYEWMFSWTIETIMKKMPEFKGGTLRIPEMGDDLPVL